MKTKAVKSIPEVTLNTGENDKLIKLIDKFQKQKSKYVLLTDWEKEYMASDYLASSLRGTLKSQCIANIKVVKRGNSIYLKKI